MELGNLKQRMYLSQSLICCLGCCEISKSNGSNMPKITHTSKTNQEEVVRLVEKINTNWEEQNFK